MPRTHLTILAATSAKYPNRPAFRTPQTDPETNNVVSWTTITYLQFQEDVNLLAHYWSRLLLQDGHRPGSIIGLWIGGYTYSDIANIYALSRAGYVPQLFSLRLPNPIVIYELLQKSQAKALIFDASFHHVLSDCPVSTYLVADPAELDRSPQPLLDMPEASSDDIAFFFHTSGSTSGSPKLVPLSYRWIESAIDKSSQIMRPKRSDCQDVCTAMGSMCHIGSTFMLLGSLQYGSCTIQPTTMTFSTQEFLSMVEDCGLNRLNAFAAFLAMRIREARKDPQVLSLLANLDETLYSGMPLPQEELAWGSQNGILIRNLFGSTECGATLLSAGGKGATAPLLRPLEGVSYSFVPLISNDSGTTHQSTARLLEFVVLSESADCPHPSLRASDGHFHTGDLFQEVMPGHYAFRGRDDDWIKSENSLRCDTKAIEENVRNMCAGLVAECIVVGTGRPSPALFVEPAVEMDGEKLKKEILRKTRQFHARRYLHERITSSNMIVIVPPKTLPRTVTKGNIRRQAVEEMFQAQLDQIYGLVR